MVLNTVGDHGRIHPGVPLPHAQVACTFIELQKKLDPKTGQVKEENPSSLRQGMLRSSRSSHQAHGHREGQGLPPAGQVAIRDMGATVAAGMCIDVEKRDMT